MNDGLAHGRYFFMDIANDGIALYQTDDTELQSPKPKTPEQALAMAKEYFEEWYAERRWKCWIRPNTLCQQGLLNEAAFELHQATERLYHCVLLVCTFYTPHVHNLGFLRTQAERLDVRLVSRLAARDTGSDRAMFEKLKDAYVKARYSKHYRISEEELTWLGAQVEELGRVVHAICSERIDALERSAQAA